MGCIPPPTVLCVTSYFKGNRFLQRCRRQGCTTYLLTLESLRDAEWDRTMLDDLFLMPSLADRRAVINCVAWLMRSRPIDLIVALDDYDVELGGALREHFRLPGLGDSACRLFRDKLAMRVRARELGLPVPEFTGLARHDRVRQFLAEVPPPWLMKPRSEASSIGIHKLHDADAVWKRLEVLGDEQSFHLLERFVPGDLYHVDTLVHDSRPVFSQVSRYHRPLLEVYQGGGIFATRTLPSDHAVGPSLSELTGRLLTGFGMHRGCSHTEWIQAGDGGFVFVETSARVGGAYIADMVEAATGMNLWEEWAAIEIAGDRPYTPPSPRSDFAGVIISLARTEWPDTSGFTDPEIVDRIKQKNHIGFVLRASSGERIEELLADYRTRIERDFHAVMPPADHPTT